MDWALASKYLAGECTHSEQRHVERWLADAPDRRALLDRLQPIDVARATSGTVDVDAAWARLSARLDHEPLQVLGGAARVPGRGRALARRPWQYAAAACALLLVALSVPVIGRLATPSPVEVVTAAGERREITLRDGSRISIAPMSRVTIQGERQVTLEGEARFTIVHDDARPFTVHTADATIKDLGTIFVVRAVAVPPGTQVAVEEGVVTLAPATKARASGTLVLRARESARIVADSGALRADSATWERSVAWTQGEIAFERTPLREVAAELHRWFGVTVRFEDPSLETRTLSARLSTSDLEEALAALERSLGASHSRHGDTVIVRP